MYLNFILIYYLLLSLLNNLIVSLFFFPFHCVFQDLHTKRMISEGFEQDGLYYLIVNLCSNLMVERCQMLLLSLYLLLFFSGIID